jgi:hypothetical protein
MLTDAAASSPPLYVGPGHLLAANNQELNLGLHLCCRRTLQDGPPYGRSLARLMYEEAKAAVEMPEEGCYGGTTLTSLVAFQPSAPIRAGPHRASCSKRLANHCRAKPVHCQRKRRVRYV